MDPKSITMVPFRRGTERRRLDSRAASNERQNPAERRTPGLGWSALFRGIDTRAIEDVVNDCEVLVLPPGTPLLKPGECNDNVYLLLVGKLTIFIDSSRTDDAGIPILSGESVGEMSAIDGKPVSALVLAVTESRVLRLPPDLFWNRISAIPGVARNLLATLSERMRRSSESLLESQRKRLALEYLWQELEVARQLQASMLPLRGPLFPNREDIEIEGMMEPASEVGGDLFDAFFVDEHRLFFCIGDVSGHGIPAALFMARTIGLMRIVAMTTGEPDRLLEQVNDQLSAGNEANIFVTLFCGFIDTRTGRMVYSNGGHLPPVLLSSQGAEFLPLPKGALVGAIQGLRYTTMEIMLDDGTALLCYTDGVTEAPAQSGSEFGEAYLLEIAASSATDTVTELLQKIRQSVASFTDHKPLVDDCTMLGLRLRLKT
jgi:phosphoserine phosphatase RsbU/P